MNQSRGRWSRGLLASVANVRDRADTQSVQMVRKEEFERKCCGAAVQVLGGDAVEVGVPHDSWKPRCGIRQLGASH